MSSVLNHHFSTTSCRITSLYQCRSLRFIWRSQWTWNRRQIKRYHAGRDIGPYIWSTSTTTRYRVPPYNILNEPVACRRSSCLSTNYRLIHCCAGHLLSRSSNTSSPALLSDYILWCLYNKYRTFMISSFRTQRILNRTNSGPVRKSYTSTCRSQRCSIPDHAPLPPPPAPSNQ